MKHQVVMEMLLDDNKAFQVVDLLKYMQYIIHVHVGR
jgi:hypothetical protein